MISVSVIIVTYKRLSYLKLAIESVLQQEYPEMEVIIVGDGDQQDISDYVNTHPDKRLKYYFVEHVGYPAVARNLGLKKASGQFIAFCDDDDVWMPNKLSVQIDILERDKSTLCFTNRLIINSTGEIQDKQALTWLPSKFNVNTLLTSNYITYSSVVLRKEILEDTGYFSEDVVYKAVEDYHLWLRIAYFGRLSFLNEHLVLYRIHTTNITFKPSIGAVKMLKVLQDIFYHYRFGILQKLKAYLIVYLKISYYFLKGIN